MTAATDKTSKTTTTAPAKVSKTKVGREALVGILKKANQPMTSSDLIDRALAVKAVKDAAVPRGTLAAQLNFALAEEPPRIRRVDRGVYAHVETAVATAID